MADDNNRQQPSAGKKRLDELLSNLRLRGVAPRGRSAGEIAAGGAKLVEEVGKVAEAGTDANLSSREKNYFDPQLAAASNERLQPHSTGDKYGSRNNFSESVPTISPTNEQTGQQGGAPPTSSSKVPNLGLVVPESPKFGTSSPEKSQKVPTISAATVDVNQTPLVDLSYLGNPALLQAQFKDKTNAEISDMVTDYLFKRLSGHDAESIFINDGTRAGGEATTLFADADILNQITNQMLMERKYDLSTLPLASGEEKYVTDMLGKDYQLALERFREDVRKQGFNQTLFSWLNKGAGFDQPVAALGAEVEEETTAEEVAEAQTEEAAGVSGGGGGTSGESGDDEGEGGDAENAAEESFEEDVEEPEEETTEKKKQKEEEIVDLQLKREIEEGIRNKDGTYSEAWLLAHPTLAQDWQLIDDINELQKQNPADFDQLPVEMQQKLGFLSAEVVARQNSEAVMRSHLMDEHDWEVRRKGKKFADEWWKEATGEDWNEENNNSGKQRVADLKMEVAREMRDEAAAGGEEFWDNYFPPIAGITAAGAGGVYGKMGDEYMYDPRMSLGKERTKWDETKERGKKEIKEEVKRRAKNKGMEALNRKFGLQDKLMDKVSGLKDGKIKDFLQNRVNQAFKPQASKISRAKDAAGKVKNAAQRLLGKKPPIPKPPVGGAGAAGAGGGGAGAAGAGSGAAAGGTGAGAAAGTVGATAGGVVGGGAAAGGAAAGGAAAGAGGVSAGVVILIVVAVILILLLIVFIVISIYLYKLELDYQKQQQAVANNQNYPVEVMVDTSITKTVNPQETGYQNDMETTVTIFVKESGQETKLSPNLSATMSYQCKDESNCPQTRDDTNLLLSAYQQSLAEWSTNSAMVNHEGATLSFKANNKILEDGQLAVGYRDFWAIQTVSVGFDYIQGSGVVVGGSGGGGRSGGGSAMSCRQPPGESFAGLDGWLDIAGYVLFMTVPNPFYGGKTGFEHALELLELPECAPGASAASGPGGWSNISPEDWERIQANIGDKATNIEYVRQVFAGAAGGSQRALAVVECESRWNPAIDNRTTLGPGTCGGYGCHGLFQVHAQWHCAKAQQALDSGRYSSFVNELKKKYGNGATATNNQRMCEDALWHPLVNTDVGWMIYQGSGWGAWSCYTGGGYLQFINNY